ncbi:MAG: hypothetical protein ACUVR3_13775 [Candidatus Roseilinea sp.]|uniref:hypothetical protein n=1 Tax=Candidatus Roseilinea sp. TaxID=2838777 RepID=UPI00404B25B2
MSLNLLALVTDDLERCSTVLDAWQEAGVSGVTMLSAAGSRYASTHDDLPLMVSLRAMLSGSQTPKHIVFALIDDDIVLERATHAALEIVGDFQAPNSGIMFVVPVTRAWGARKTHRPEP